MATKLMDEHTLLRNELSVLTQMLQSHKQMAKPSVMLNGHHFPKHCYGVQFNPFSRNSAAQSKYKVNRIMSKTSTSHFPKNSISLKTNINVRDNRPNIGIHAFPTGSSRISPKPSLLIERSLTKVKMPLLKSNGLVTNSFRSKTQQDGKYTWVANKTSNQFEATNKFNEKGNTTSTMKSKYRKVNNSPKLVSKPIRKVNRLHSEVNHKVIKLRNTLNYNRTWRSNRFRFFCHNLGKYQYKVSTSNISAVRSTTFQHNILSSTNQYSFSKCNKRKLINVNAVKLVSGNRRRLLKSEGITKSLDAFKINKLLQTSAPSVKQKKTNQMKYIANRVVNRSIFCLNVAKAKSKKYCLFYNKFGKCNKKETGTCPYIHDPEKVAVCTRFLSGECKVEKCPFAHSYCRSKMPACSFFLQGTCHNGEKCNYSHVNVSKDADICTDFANGYCSSGDKCKKWHLTRCNQFELKGCCDREKCPLLHRKRTIETPSILSTNGQPGITKFSRNTKLNCANDGNAVTQENILLKPLPAFIPISGNDKDNSPGSIPGVGNSLQIRPSFLMTE